MSTCSHGRDLSTQVCKYCSCTHGNIKENCAACTAVAGIKTTPAPAIWATCVHGVEMNRLCAKCMAAGALGSSGSVSVPMWGQVTPAPDTKKLDYEKRVEDMDKVPGAMRMFRTWSLDESNNLTAMVASYHWKRGENESTPMHQAGHTGFFGFASLAQLQKQEKKWWELSQNGEPQVQQPPYSLRDMHVPPKMQWYVSGTFLGYGHMVIAEHGGRSHFAIPEYIIEPDGSDPDFGMRIVMVAEKYGMKIISTETATELKTGSVPYWKGKPIE